MKLDELYESKIDTGGLRFFVERGLECDIINDDERIDKIKSFDNKRGCFFIYSVSKRAFFESSQNLHLAIKISPINETTRNRELIFRNGSLI